MTSALKSCTKVFFLVLICALGTQAATINAANCSFAAVSSAVSAAVDGDTVVIPACPAGVSWTTKLTVTKGITIQGQGIGVTVLVDNVPKGDSNCANANQMLALSVNSPLSFRLTGITIRGGVPDTNRCNTGHLAIGGTSKMFRVDHVRFENQQTSGIRTFGDLWGVIDHCEFQGVFTQGVIIFHDGWNGQRYGDGSWATPTKLGSQEFIFIEDCIFEDPLPVGAGAFDIFNGGRIVFRRNNASFMATHGTESGGRQRGVRAFEIYDNTFTAANNPQFAALLIRGGTGVFHSNRLVGTYLGMVTIDNDRDSDTFNPWGTCSGTSPFDQNDGVVYVSGTHNGASGVTNILTDTTKNFTTACSSGNCAGNGFSVRNVTKGWGSSIASVTTTTVTNRASGFGGSRIWDAGDNYQILRTYPCLDQVGRGQGSLLSGDTPTPAAWPNQVLEPVYQWNNTVNGVGSPTMGSNSIHVRANRDYFDNVVMPGYAPFPYPHPLTLSSGGAPGPPGNLRQVSP